jgi:hypothetical protein
MTDDKTKIGSSGTFYEVVKISVKEYPGIETFAQRDIFLSGKEGENLNRRNTLGILRINI